MASTRSSRVRHGAGALAHPYRLSIANQVDHLSDGDLEGQVGIVAEAGGHGAHAADVAVVVGTEHDHEAVEAPLALVEVVGAVGGEVGPVAVGLTDDAVLVVAEVGGAQPDGAILLVDVALLAEAA